MPSPVCVLDTLFVRLHQYTQRCIHIIARIVCLALIQEEIAHKSKLVRNTAIPIRLHDLKVFVMNVGADIIIRLPNIGRYTASLYFLLIVVSICQHPRSRASGNSGIIKVIICPLPCSVYWFTLLLSVCAFDKTL